MNHVNKLIPNILFGQKDICTYCGEEADSIDHVVPIAFYGLKRKDLTNDMGIRTYACHSCNSSLGCRVFTTFAARLKHMTAVHTRRAQKTKTKWSEKELAEMDYTLRTFIQSKKNTSEQNYNKTKWSTSPRFKKLMSKLKDLEELQSSSPEYVEWAAVYFKGYL